MKFRRIRLASAIIFSSAFTLSLVTNCASNVVNEDEKFSIKSKINMSEGATIEFSKTEGKVGEDVSVTITLKEKYSIKDILINNSSRESKETNFSFQPTSGENVVEVILNKFGDGAYFKLDLVYDSSKGKVEADITEGTTDQTINISIEPFTNYMVSTIMFNEEYVDVSQRIFIPKEGNNTLVVEFFDNASKDNWELNLNHNEGGVVTIDKTKGKIGEAVQVNINANDGYLVHSIKINKETLKNNTSLIYPSHGVNTLYVKFVKEADVLDNLDYGFELNYNFSKVEGKLIETNSDITKAVIKAITDLNLGQDVYDRFVTNEDPYNYYYYLLKFAKKLYITDFQLANVFKFFLKTTYSNERQLSRFGIYKKIACELNIKEFTLIRIIMLWLEGPKAPSDIIFREESFYTVDTIKNHDSLITKYKDYPEIVSYIENYRDNALNDSRILNDSTIEEITETYKTESEFLYKIMHGFLNYISSEEEYQAFIQGANSLVYDLETYTKYLKFYGEFILQHFASFEGFKKYFYNKTQTEVIQDLNEVGVYNVSELRELCPDLYKYKNDVIKDAGDVYYTLKFYGHLLKDITVDEVKSLYFNYTGEIDQPTINTAKGFVKLMQRANDYFKKYQNNGELIKKHFVNGRKHLDQISSFYRFLKINAPYNKTIFTCDIPYKFTNETFLIKTMQEVASIDLDNVSNETVSKIFNDFLVNCPRKNSNLRIMWNTFQKTYNIGESLNLSFTYMDDKDNQYKQVIIKEEDTSNFRTDKLGNRIASFSFLDYFRGCFDYNVVNNTKKYKLRANGTMRFEKGFDLSEIRILAEDISSYGYKEIEVSKENLFGLDNNKVGDQYVALKYEGEYYFFLITVIESSK